MFPLILAGGAALAAVFLSGCQVPKNDCPQGPKLDTAEPTRSIQFNAGAPNAAQVGQLQDLARNAPASPDLQDPQLTKIIGPLFKDRAVNLRSFEAIAAAMQRPENAGKKFAIAVHASSDSTPEVRQQLTQRRAESARSLLIYLGVPENRITARGYGDACLLVPEAGRPDQVENAKAANRRVEIFVR